MLNSIHIVRTRLRWLVLAFGVMLACGAQAVADEIPVVQPVRVIQIRSHGEGLPAPVVTAVALRGDGDLLAAGGDDHLVRIWHLPSGRLLRSLSAHSDWVHAVEFSPDGKTLTSAGADGRVLFWSLDNLRHPQELVRRPSGVAQICYVRQGSAVLVAGFDSKMEMYDVATGQPIRSFSCPCRDIRAIAVSPNEMLVAAAGRNGIIRVWEVDSGEKLWDRKAHRMRIRDLVFSQDSMRLVSASEDRTIRIWNVETSALEKTLPRQRAKVMAISLLENGRVVVAGSDNTVQVLDFSSGKQVLRLVGHTGSVSALDSVGTILVSGSFDTTVGVWDLSQQSSVTTQLEPRARGDMLVR